jgi:hypothetical protein
MKFNSINNNIFKKPPLNRVTAMNHHVCSGPLSICIVFILTCFKKVLIKTYVRERKESIRYCVDFISNHIRECYYNLIQPHHITTKSPEYVNEACKPCRTSHESFNDHTLKISSHPMHYIGYYLILHYINKRWFCEKPLKTGVII